MIITTLNFIIGGLHLFNPINRRTEKLDFVKELGGELSQKDIKIYTCHCTGDKEFKELENRLCSNIDTLKTGQVIELLNEN